MKKVLFFSLFASVILTSCETDTDLIDPIDPTDSTHVFTDGVFILNEGNYLGGNATLSFYNKLNDSLSNGVFTAVNQIPLGDVAQSMAVRGDRGFIVVNNSGKIESVNLDDLSSAGTLSGLSSPRYIAFASNTKAYVTDLFANTITVFNPETMTATGSIATNGWTEEIVVLDGSAYVAGAASGYLYKVNTTTDQLTDSLFIGEEPVSIVVDGNGKLWVLTTGGWQVEVPKLVRVNPATMAIEETLPFLSIDSYPGNLCINATGDVIYYLDGAVYSISLNASALPLSPMVPGYFYKLGLDKAEGHLYVTDPVDYNSNGKVYRYTMTGTAIDTLSVGLIPGNFCFTGQ
ncbi:MAG: hypothetical protein K9J06_14880 [Flavobacteriales bacterium]|nr:hypothetical protein [Flavobacteriales bacterium]